MEISKYYRIKKSNKLYIHQKKKKKINNKTLISYYSFQLFLFKLIKK